MMHPIVYHMVVRDVVRNVERSMMGPDFSELDSLPPEPHGGKAHIFKSELSGEWYMRLLAANGEIIMASEGHKNYDDVMMLRDKYFPMFTLSDEHGEPV